MELFTYKNLYKAYLDCRKNKRQTINALKFEINLEDNLKELLEELRSGTYRPGRSICFVVTEPCPREIFAADFRDRIVHHLFVRELIDQAEKMFIFDSYACRVGKGTHKAVSRLYSFTNRMTRDYRADAWYMQLDLKSFFMSIERDILYGLALELIDKHKKLNNWKLDMSELAGIIIFHDPKENYIRKGGPALAGLIPPHKSLFGIKPGKGLPIGNYSSQFFANLYLNKLDHFIKRELKCEYYIRYVDDLIFLHKNREKLKTWRDGISLFLKEKLAMELNIKKTKIQHINKGIDFLGYFLKLNKIHTRRKVYKRYKNKLFKAAIGVSELPWNKLRTIAASRAGQGGYF